MWDSFNQTALQSRAFQSNRHNTEWFKSRYNNRWGIQKYIGKIGGFTLPLDWICWYLLVIPQVLHIVENFVHSDKSLSKNIQSLNTSVWMFTEIQLVFLRILIGKVSLSWWFFWSEIRAIQLSEPTGWQNKNYLWQTQQTIYWLLTV